MNETKIVAEAVEGQTLQEITKSCGTSVSTVQRRLNLPSVGGGFVCSVERA